MKRAVCTGSFDPVTNGHVDVFRRAAAMFDELVICVFHNVKKQSMFTAEERVAFLQEAVKDLPNVRVDSFSGLVTDYLREKDLHIIVRGIRDSVDFEYEQKAAQMNRLLGDDVETVFILTSPEYSCVSSSVIRELAAFGRERPDLVPECVARAIRKRIDLCVK